MSKRLQVLLDEGEMRQVVRSAKRQRVTVSEWVRRALRAASRQEPARDPEGKIDAIRAAARHEFPTADIDKMLKQIERGYLSDRER